MIMFGDIDLWVFDVMDFIFDFSGVNDNVFGVVGMLEVVWILI